MYHCFLKREVEVMFHLSMIIADTVESNPFIGLKAHNSVCGCRCCMTSKADMWPVTPERLDAIRNSPRLREAMYILLERNTKIEDPSLAQDPAEVKDAKAALSEAGLPEHISGWLWFALESSFDPYLHSPYCLLHQLLLGTVKKHLTVEVDYRKHRKAFITAFNTRMKSLHQSSRVPSIRSLENLSSWTGTEMAVFCSVALIVLQRLVPREHLEVWRSHIRMANYLCRPNLKSSQLDRIDTLYEEFSMQLDAVYGKLKPGGIIGPNDVGGGGDANEEESSSSESSNDKDGNNDDVDAMDVDTSDDLAYRDDVEADPLFALGSSFFFLFFFWNRRHVAHNIFSFSHLISPPVLTIIQDHNPGGVANGPS
jgi:hypothetical protein